MYLRSSWSSGFDSGIRHDCIAQGLMTWSNYNISYFLFSMMDACAIYLAFTNKNASSHLFSIYQQKCSMEDAYALS